MPAQELKDVSICTEATTLDRIYGLMKEKGTDFVVVVENRAHRIPLGIVTEHLICEQIIGRLRDPRGMTAANVMSTKIVKVPAGVDPASINTSMEGPTEFPIVVIDENGEMVGVLKDLAHAQRATGASPLMAEPRWVN